MLNHLGTTVGLLKSLIFDITLHHLMAFRFGSCRGLWSLGQSVRDVEALINGGKNRSCPTRVDVDNILRGLLSLPFLA